MVRHTTAEVCGECGARVKPGAEVCDLCGNPLDDTAKLSGGIGGADIDELHPAPVAGPAILMEEGGPFCNTCGWRNPSGARFCSQCGEPLQDISAAGLKRSAATRGVPVGAALPRSKKEGVISETEGRNGGGDQDRSAVTRQVTILVAAGTLLVIALYLITVFSKNLGSSVSNQGEPARGAVTTAQEQPSAPLPSQVAGEAAALEDEIASLSGDAKAAKQRELVELYLRSGRLDLAAQEQERLAESVNTVEAWSNAGHYYYGWMEQVEGQARMEAGQKAIAAYQRVLEEEPGNNDVRTDMATAFLYTNNPMEGVNQIKQVLESDPNHVQANFNYGVMLSMIGRVDQAIAQFEKVKGLVPEDSDNYRKAEEGIRVLREQSGSASQ